jgi:predicted DCC family thiol-disulfide oxidoreductase YuxK
MSLFIFEMTSVNTEITDKEAKHLRGWVLYDDTCPICRREAGRWQAVFARRGFHFAPLQLSWAKTRQGLPADTLPSEMKLLLTDGRELGGAEALAELARQIWWLRPFGVLASLPSFRPGFDAAYRWLARNRYRLRGQCELSKTAHACSPRHRCSALFETP